MKSSLSVKKVAEQLWRSTILFVVFAGWMNAASADLDPEAEAEASPLKKIVFKKRYDASSFLPDREQGEEIINLDPLVVTPLVTSTDRLIEDVERDPEQFLTKEGWRDNMGYRSSFDEFLNLFSIPYFGLKQEHIAYMYGQDAMLGEKVEKLDLLIDARSLNRKSTIKKYTQDRYDLMRMKRHALFGNSWALPEIGK